MRHHPANPWAPLTDRQLRRQARADVRMGVLPISRQIGREAHSGEKNIAGIAQQLAQGLGAYQGQVADIYGRARSSLGALDTAQQGALEQKGGGLAEALSKQLAASGNTQDLAGALTQTTHGAAGSGLARGSAEVGALTGMQAHGEEYAAKQPGIARLAGLQGVNERAALAQKQQGELASQLPTSISQAIRAARAQEFNKAAAQLAYTGRLQTTQMAQQGANARTAASQAGANSRTAAQQAGANARTAAQQAGAYKRTQANINATAAKTGRSYDEGASRNAGHAVDHQGRPIINPKTGRPYPFREPPKSKGKKKSGINPKTGLPYS